MADFRKWFSVLAMAALLMGTVVTASAQVGPALTCTSNAGVPPILRAEGLTELVGDLVLNCTGGNAASSFQANFQIFLNTNITSRLLTGGPGFVTGANQTEALLMIDEPVTPVLPATGVTGNTFRGIKVTENAIAWLGVPFTPPGSTGVRIIRITNVRANAAQLLPPGSSASLIPPQVVMYISISGSQAVPVNNPQQVVGYVQTGLTFALSNCADDGGIASGAKNLLQCVSVNSSAAGDVSKAGVIAGTSLLKFSENFATAFKVGFASGQDPSVPGTVYNTESGYVNTTVLGTETGRSTQGTRLAARFANIPNGVKLRVGVMQTLGITTAGVVAGGSSPSVAADLTTTDSNGAGTFSAVSATSTIAGCADLTKSGNVQSVAPVTISGGTGMAVWEVDMANPFITEKLLFLVEVDFAADTQNNSPALGKGTVNGTYAPFYSGTTGTTMSATLPIPRFVDAPQSKDLLVISACVTNLLFPYVTNREGYDSGMAISNTSLDIFDTKTQQGVCEINYFAVGDFATSKTKETSQVIPPGGQLVWTLSGGGLYGVTGNPKFQGYIIAKCFFQYAHGYAFVSDMGANRVAEGYLALVMDTALSNRTGSTSEALNN